MAAEKVHHFSGEELRRLHRQATKRMARVGSPPPGWSKSRVSPMRLLGLFSPLGLKPHFVLRAYQYHDGHGNGNGMVWALPKGRPLPAPEACPVWTEHPLKPPRPAGAVQPMTAITGDGTPWSYLLASFLARELGELGAMWHGTAWAIHEILDENPFAPNPAQESTRYGWRGRPQDWEWTEEVPADWRPSVGREGTLYVVTFFTYSPVGREAIYRHVDRYETPGSYGFISEQTVVALGQGGMVF